MEDAKAVEIRVKARDGHFELDLLDPLRLEERPGGERGGSSTEHAGRTQGSPLRRARHRWRGIFQARSSWEGRAAPRSRRIRGPRGARARAPRARRAA